MSLLSQFYARLRGWTSGVGSLRCPPPRPPPQLEARSSPTPESNSIHLSQLYVQMAQDLRSSFPLRCNLLGPQDVNSITEQPTDAGGFANIYEAMHGGQKVVLKSYRCYMSFDVVQVVVRFHNEVHICSLLHQGSVDVVPLVGVYSTETHPFGLVYEYMDGLDLRQYLTNEPSAGRLNLLTRIARCLNRVHDLGIVHGNIQMKNILVDKDGTPRIAGLGNASILPHSTDWTADGRTSTNQLSRSHALELTQPGELPKPTNAIHPAVASDMYAFGTTAWEVLTGRPPFFEMGGIAATYSMLSGNRPPRPDHHEISDGVWYMIERCWHNIPSKRMSAREAADLLEKELGRTSDSHALSSA